MTAAELVDSIRVSLRDRANPALAPGQQAYMKSVMPFFGVKVPEVRTLTKQLAKGMRDTDELREAAETLWRDATHREERYAALTLLSLRPLRARLDMLELYEEMIRTGTDTELLTIAIESNSEDTEFFIRKAIGWALREYAKTDADWVRAFVAAHPELSGLSQREALKHLG